MIMFWFIFVLFSICDSAIINSEIGVRHLVGEPDYRAVRLRWEAFPRTGGSRALPPFQVRYCELQSWGTQRCRTQDVPNPIHLEHDSNEVPGVAVANLEDNTHIYAADVEGLRMATTYSFEIRPATTRREERADDVSDDNVIIIPTKGFSAKATQCLPHASEIEVSTGPHFAGRITVEATDGERCTIDGESDSPRDTYVLHIDHKECGSYVNETTVATYVIVQENLPILTHSTRRFLVLCSYQPETLTVRAGLSLPSSQHSRHHGKGHGISESVNPDQDINTVRRSRQLRPARLEAPEVGQDESNHTFVENDDVTPAALMSILAVFGICSFILIAFKWRRMYYERNHLDTESIGSDLSISTDVEDNPSNLSIIETPTITSSASNSFYNHNCNIARKSNIATPKNHVENI